jgi:serine/threonine protein kinase
MDFKMIEFVGQGSFGVVRKCKSIINNKIYAIKSINLCGKKVDDKMSEVEILKDLKHPNIIEYCGYFVGFDFGSWANLLSPMKTEPLRESLPELGDGNSLAMMSDSQVSIRAGSPIYLPSSKIDKSSFSWPGKCLHIVMEFAEDGDI